MKQSTIDNALESLRHLDGMIADRINDHREQKGHMQAVHAFVFYSSSVKVAQEHIIAKDYGSAIKTLESLYKMFDQRIADLHEVKGVQHYRHAFCHYRRQVGDAWFPMRDELEKGRKK
jgi:hypothetical protein